MTSSLSAATPTTCSTRSTRSRRAASFGSALLLASAMALPAGAQSGGAATPPPPPGTPQDGGRPEGGGGQGQQDGQRREGRGGPGGFFGGGQRGGGGGFGGGGGMMRRFQDSFRPEFLRRDMPTMRDRLALDAGQVTLVEALLSDYDTQFSPASEAAQEKLREAMQSIGQSFFTEEMRGKVEQAMQAMRSDLEQIAQESGGEIDPEVRTRLIRERMQKFQEEMVKEREASGAQSQMKETIGGMIDVIEKWHVERTTMRDQLLNGVRATLSDAQKEKWQAFDRFMRRERTIPLGAISGEQVNLFLVVDEAGLTPETMASITPILDRYELELDAALRARNEFAEQSEIKVLRAAQSSNTREVEEIARRASELHKVVRDVNDRYRVELVAALPEENRAKVDRAALVAGYERVYRPTQAERSFDAALEFPDISPELRTAIESLQTQYGVDVQTLNERIMMQMKKQEPAELVEESGRLVALANGVPPMPGMGRRFGGPGGQGGQAGTDPLGELFTKRGDLSESYVRRLRELLTPEQQAQLPQRNRGGGGGRFGGGQGGQGGLLGSGKISEMPEGMREQAKRFDVNNDGSLDDTERAAAIEAFRRDFGGRRGGGEGGGDGGGGDRPRRREGPVQ